MSKRVALLSAAALAVVALFPAEALAQRVRVFAGVGFYRAPIYRPYFYRPLFYDPFWFGQWYPYPYPYPYYYGRRADIAEARLEIRPRDAQVYLDGYYMGTVGDFDGTFQRLELPGGDHEITVYLRGYRTYRQRNFFRPGQSYHYKAILEPLAPGAQQEPPPQPPAEPARRGAPGQYRRYPPQGGENYPPPPPEGRRAPEPAPEAPSSAEVEGFGTLTLRVQPADAVVTIDGERWDSPQGGSRLVVQLPAGAHRVEVSKEGYTPYSTSVDLRAGEERVLNVSLGS
jgi:hypothetical protein